MTRWIYIAKYQKGDIIGASNTDNQTHILMYDKGFNVRYYAYDMGIEYAKHLIRNDLWVRKIGH